MLLNERRVKGQPYARTQTICLVIIAAALVAGFAYWFRGVLVPFALAAFLALILSSVVDLQVQKLKFPRGLAVLSTFLMGMVLVFLTSLVVSASVADLANKSDQYLKGFSELWNTAAKTLASIPGADQVQDRTGMDPRQLTEKVAGSVTSALGSLMSKLTGNVLNLVSQSMVVLMFLGFLLAGDGGKRALPGVWGEISDRIQQYMVTKTLLSAATGFLVAVVLALIGLDLAMVFGLLAFVFNFIPNIGSMISTCLPLPLILFSPGLTTTQRVLAFVIPGIVQFVIGNIVEPMVLGDSLDLHPVVILLTLMLWGALWGGVGMFLATPLTAMMKIFFEHLESTRPLALLLSGRIGEVLGAEEPPQSEDSPEHESAGKEKEPCE